MLFVLLQIATSTWTSDLKILLRLFFHHLYHELAWWYDFIAAFVSIGRWKDWRKAALSYAHGPNILEVGFGTGQLQVELYRQGLFPVGLDESRQMAAIGFVNILRNNFRPRLLRGLAQALPFAPLTFDSVIITFPSEYISEKQTLAELWRVIKPSGQLIVVPMARISGKSALDRAAIWLFQITGQAENSSENLESRLKLFFDQAGFQTSIINEHVRDSSVTVVLAVKPVDILKGKTNA